MIFCLNGSCFLWKHFMTTVTALLFYLSWKYVVSFKIYLFKFWNMNRFYSKLVNISPDVT